MKDILGAILKICGFLLTLPLIAASFIAFQTHLLSLPASKEAWLLWGAGIYVAFNLFVYDFKDIFAFGNSVVEKIVTFFKPAGYIIPVISIFIIIIYVLAWVLGRGPVLQPYFLFLIAFTLTMHWVLTAHQIYEADKSVLKAHYLFVFGLILVAAFIIMSLLLAWVIPEYSFIGFIKSLAQHTAHLYKSVYRTLFVD